MALWRLAMRVLLANGITRADVERGDAGLEDAFLLGRDAEKLQEQFEDVVERGRSMDGNARAWLTDLDDWD